MLSPCSWRNTDTCDRDGTGGLSGFLNQPTEAESLPLYIDQGGPQSIAGGIGQDPSLIRLADLDGDGKDDYVGVLTFCCFIH